MDEIYRMLGREHEADLAREAAKFARADLVRGTPRRKRGARVLLTWSKRVRAVSLPRALRSARAPSASD
jgi:hypothetical protein